MVQCTNIMLIPARDGADSVTYTKSCSLFFAFKQDFQYAVFVTVTSIAKHSSQRWTFSAYSCSLSCYLCHNYYKQRLNTSKRQRKAISFIFCIQFHILYPISNFVSNSIFCTQFHILYPISYFVSNFIFCTQFHILYPISYCVSNIIFCIQFHILYPVSYWYPVTYFVPNFIFFIQFHIVFQISHFLYM